MLLDRGQNARPTRRLPLCAITWVCRTGRRRECSRTEPVPPPLHGLKSRIGSQELLARRDRGGSPCGRTRQNNFLARPRGFPLRNLTPLRCGGSRVHRTTQWRRSQGANAASPSPPVEPLPRHRQRSVHRCPTNANRPTRRSTSAPSTTTPPSSPRPPSFTAHVLH
jgi:hypothetical protein